MGEAKRRGTYEQRRDLAIAKQEAAEAEASVLFEAWKAKQTLESSTEIVEAEIVNE
jgi:hypothetical protein